MNLKGFKKVSEDEHKAVMNNKHGHSITIAKKSLSKSHLEELGKLPLHAADGVDTIPDAEPLAVDSAPPEPQALPEQAPTELAQNEANSTPGVAKAPQPPVPSETINDSKPQVETPEQVAAAEAQKHDQEAFREWQDKLQGHIKPKTYQSLYADKSTLGKIGTIFGLMLSGAGSGLSHQPNALLEMMNKEIDRDLEAQKKEVEGSQNYYHLHQQNEFNKANIKKTGVETSGLLKDVQHKALENAKTSMQLDVAHKVLQDADLLPAGPLKAQAIQNANHVQSAVSQDIQQRNARLGNTLVSDPEGSYQKKQQALRTAGNIGVLPGAEGVANANDERHIPGVGTASIPVSPNVRQELISHQKLENAGLDLLDYSKKHTNLIPGTAEYNVGSQKALVLQQMVREGLLGTVFRESEKPLLNKFVNENPAGVFKMISTQPKLKTLLEENAMAGNTLKQAYGIPTSHKGNEPSEEIKVYKGKKYKRGKNGEAIEVK